MNAWELPKKLIVGGIDYDIRTDYRVILDILAAMNDPEIFDPGMTDEEKKLEKAMTMIQILYVDFEKIPSNCWQEAVDKASEFIDCGMKDTGQHKPRLMDWEQDAAIIVPAVNKVAGIDVRSVKYMHWWTFLGFYMEIGECLLATVVSIRDKKRRGKKLEKWEKEFYQNNRSLVDFKVKREERSDKEKEELRKIFGFMT